MHRTFIVINEDMIEGTILSENNEIIAISHVSFDIAYEDLWLNKNFFYQYVKELITKLEQICSVSISNVYLSINGFIDYQCKTAIYKIPISLQEEIANVNTTHLQIDTHQTFYINNKHYIFDFDTQFLKYIHILGIYINKIVCEYMNVIFGYSNIQINKLTFLPLDIAKTMHCNSIVVFLYNNKLVLAIKKDHNINIYSHNLKNAYNYNIQNLNFTFGDFENVSNTRRFIHQINEYLNEYLTQYTTPFTVYFSGKFVYIPDMIEYIYYLNDNIHDYKFLDANNYHISENTILYGSLLKMIDNYK